MPSRKSAAPKPPALNPLTNPPGPDARLADLPEFPPEAAASLAARGVRTLADLRPHVESAAAEEPNGEPVFVLFGRWALPVPARYKAGETLIGVLGGRAAMLAAMTTWPAPPPKQPCGCQVVVNGLKGAHEKGCPYVAAAVRSGETLRQWAAGNAPAAEEFDENTPPPRTRPRGDPAPNYLELPPGESITGVWHDWDMKGRVAEGSVLARFAGLSFPADIPGAVRRPPADSGYRIAGNPVRGGAPLGRPGAVVTAAATAAYRIASVLRETPSGVLYVVLSPLKPKVQQ